jgi:hypothetical protein
MKMKIKTWVSMIVGTLFSIAIYFFFVSAISVKAGSNQRPRFEQIYTENHGEVGTNLYEFEVWHDKETGQEFICARSLREESCWLTGRSW